MTAAGSSEFLAFVQRLTRAINVAIPDDTHALVKIESRTHAAMNAACDLCLAAFKLSRGSRVGCIINTGSRLGLHPARRPGTGIAGSH